MHDADTDIGPADIDGKDRIVRMEDPRRGKMRGADETCFIRIVTDRHQIGVDAIGLEDHRSAPDRQFADAAGAEAAADDDALRVLPRLCLDVAPQDDRELLREVFDRAVQNPAGLGIALRENGVEGLLADVLARFVAKRVLAELSQRLSPILKDGAERAFAGSIPDEAFIVFQFDIVGIDIDGRQVLRPMRQRWPEVSIVSPCPRSPYFVTDNGTAGERFTDEVVTQVMLTTLV